MKSNLALVATAGLVALSGCEGEARRDAPEAELTTQAEPPASATPASIIRPEVIAEKAVAPPVAPLDATIPFGEGGFSFTPEAERALAEVLESDQVAEGWPIVLRGHTDSVGHDEVNLRASRQRAEAVAEWLIENGVDEDRIEIIALGEQRPIAPNALPDGSPDDEGRAKNRRVTVHLAPLDAAPPVEVLAEPEPASEG